MSIKTIHNEFPLEVLESLFDNNKFYIKLFKNLLNAVITNDFSNLSRTPTEITNLYASIRSKVEKFIMEEIYENIFASRAYDSLITALIDIYAVIYTVVYMRQNITDLTIQPDDVVDAYLDMFGFHCKELFNYIQRREICKVVYWYLRRKGTPSLIIKLLGMLGFNYFYLAEFQIYEKLSKEDDSLEDLIFGDSSDKHLYKTKLLYEELPENDSIGFFDETNYDYTQVRNEDPLLIKSDEEVTNEVNMTFPAQSPYYQVGVIVTYTHLERMIAAFTYAMIIKTYLYINDGEDVFTSKVNGYKNNVSFISLILGYTYILAEYFGIHDNNLYEPYTIKEAYDIENIKYDIGRIPSRWQPFDGNKLPEFEEFDGGSAIDEYELILDAGNCGFESDEYNGGISITNNYIDDIDNQHAIDSNITSDINGGYSDAPQFTKESKFDGEHDGGFADSFIIEDNREDNFFLRNGYTYAKYDFGELSRREIGDMKTPNERNTYDRDVDPVLYDIYGNVYDKENAARNISDNPEENILYKLKYPVFGWQKPVITETPMDIMVDIDNELKRLCSKLHWQPDEVEIRLVNRMNTIVREKNNIKTRRDKNLDEIFDIFYGKPIYGNYQRALASFIDHDNNFKEYIDSILLTADQRLALAEEGKLEDLAKNFDDVIQLLNNILEAVEYFIFDNTSYILPVRNLVLTYDKIIRMLEKLDKYYTPYHAKLLFPFIAWMIRDLPGDQIAIDDSEIISTGRISSIRDVVWRASHYNIYDVNPPDPYAPIEDWQCDNPNMPHIPISTNYLDEVYYDREALQVANNFLYSIGYDWRNLDEEGFIVRSECLKPIWDWDPDLIQSIGESVIYDGFDVMRPDHDQLKLIDQIQKDLEERLRYFDVYTGTIVGDGEHRIFNIKHNFNTKDIFVNIYDLSDGYDIEAHILRHGLNDVLVTFNSKLANDKKYRVIIVAPLLKDSINNRRLTGGLFNIVGNGRLKHFLCIHHINTDDSFIEVYDKFSGENVGVAARRFNKEMSIVSFNLPPNDKRKYRINTMSVFDDDTTLTHVEPHETVFIGFDINIKYNKTIVLDHMFFSNNVITRIYDRDTNEDVDALITHLNNYQISIDFSETTGSGKYRVIMMGALRIISQIAAPLNNITAHSQSFFGDGKSTVFNIQHNLNSMNTFEQVIDADTGEFVRVLVERVDKDNIQLIFNSPPNSNKDYIVNVFAPMNTHTLAYPSTCYNTALKQFIIQGVYDGLAEYNGGFGISTNIEYNNELNGGKNYEDVPDHNAGQSTTKDSDIKEIFDGASNDDIELDYNAGRSIPPNKDPDLELDNAYAPTPNINTEINGGSSHNVINKIAYSYDLDGGEAIITAILPEFSNMRISGGYANTQDHQYMLQPSITDFKIKHDIHNKNVTVQIYNHDGLKVNTYVEILDEDNVLVSFKNPVDVDDKYYVNILSLPDTTIPIKNFNKANYNTMFIDMYHQSLPIREYNRNLDKIVDLDGGYGITEEELYEFQYDGGIASTNEKHFRDIIDAGMCDAGEYKGYTSFSINHNLNTKIVMVSVFNEDTKETVDTHIVINDENWVTIGFKFLPSIKERYHVVVIGALPSDNIIDGDEFDVDHYRSSAIVI